MSPYSDIICHRAVTCQAPKASLSQVIEITAPHAATCYFLVGGSVSEYSSRGYEEQVEPLGRRTANRGGGANVCSGRWDGNRSMAGLLPHSFGAVRCSGGDGPHSLDGGCGDVGGRGTFGHEGIRPRSVSHLRFVSPCPPSHLFRMDRVHCAGARFAQPIMAGAAHAVGRLPCLQGAHPPGR
jgi:hypothetical protein